MATCKPTVCRYEEVQTCPYRVNLDCTDSINKLHVKWSCLHSTSAILKTKAEEEERFVTLCHLFSHSCVVFAMNRSYRKKLARVHKTYLLRKTMLFSFLWNWWKMQERQTSHYFPDKQIITTSVADCLHSLANRKRVHLLALREYCDILENGSITFFLLTERWKELHRKQTIS